MAYAFQTIPAQRNQINLEDPKEVSWWCKRFGCSEQQLRQAVEQVGGNAAQVEQLLDGMHILHI